MTLIWVYHFVNFPKDDAICIVKVNGTYQFYVKEGVERTEQNNIPDIIIDAPVDEDTYHEVGSDTPAKYGTGHDDMETSNGKPAFQPALRQGGRFL